MDKSQESQYPITFRHDVAKALGEYIRVRHSVELIGMKRVGISNFLRFFLHHKDVVPTYISDTEKHLFIPVDLNDLIERELFPFWILTFKRLVDHVEDSTMVSSKAKKLISNLFLSSIQSNDLFLTTENLRRAFVELTREDIIPTIFFIRFDRIRNAISHAFFLNLQGLREATGQKLSFVFTSYKPLGELVPEADPRTSLGILDSLYLKPAHSSDMKIIFQTLSERYNLKQKSEMVKKIIDISCGHVQILQLTLVMLHQKDSSEITEENLSEILAHEERMLLLCEEIWESLSSEEKDLLKHVQKNYTFSQEERALARYLFDSGIISEDENNEYHLFSPIFSKFLENKKQSQGNNDNAIELTKKEHALYSLLLDNIDTVCERDKIIEAVWPEYEEFGVSDWTIDRLTARLRTKLKKQNSPYSIITVKTRGYKMIKS